MSEMQATESQDAGDNEDELTNALEDSQDDSSKDEGEKGE